MGRGGYPETPEFHSISGARSSDQILNQLHLGILGRNVDPSGRATYLGRIQAGAYEEVLIALIESEEFSRRYPTAS
jgi:hypothetical protein